MRLWDTKTCYFLRALVGHERSITDIAFSPDGQTLASCSYDGTVRLWDAATCEQKHVLTGHPKWVIGLAFSPDGTTLASRGGDRDTTVCLWDTEDREDCVTRLPAIRDGFQT